MINLIKNQLYLFEKNGTIQLQETMLGVFYQHDLQSVHLDVLPLLNSFQMISVELGDWFILTACQFLRGILSRDIREWCSYLFYL